MKNIKWENVMILTSIIMFGAMNIFDLGIQVNGIIIWLIFTQYLYIAAIKLNKKGK